MMGALSKISGGAHVMSRRCCIMCAVRDRASQEARSDPIATQTRIRPRRNPVARQAGAPFEEVERMRSQPRQYTNAARARSRVSRNDHSRDTDRRCTRCGMTDP